ncbi:helix-turn-helix transcriptional regulator [Microbacterium azadirachtae]|uniref:Helix-turn-helix domain protein n=1 Tax=Microbacterium azadirachtae TaxID=582680 RepID=A0A0F0LQM9_9MICO|nr:helix-turn-helix domain-containing protein [Microbacterium azadirachtae]KJL35458.1 Helix-turn-helix domain protein [Microbacterium azadirachtae]
MSLTAEQPSAVKLLFVNEVAERLRRSPAQIRWMLQNGTAPKHAKIGGRICFRESDVESYIAEAFEEA